MIFWPTRSDGVVYKTLFSLSESGRSKSGPSGSGGGGVWRETKTSEAETMRFDAPASSAPGDTGNFEDPFSRRFLSFSGDNAGMSVWASE